MAISCDLINLLSGLTSLILSIVAIALSITFYLAARKSEVETAKMQISINDKVKTLGIINNDLLSAAIKHLGDSNTRMIDLLHGYNKNIEAVKEQRPKQADSPPKPDVRKDILSSIKLLTAKTGRAISMEVFDLLKREYAFDTILSELLRMNSENLITWDEAPQPPSAVSAIRTFK